MKALALILAVLLTGCASMRPEQVLIPVAAECPAPVLPARPYLPVADLPANATPEQVARAYATSLQLATDYAEALEVLLSAYDKKKETTNEQ